MFFVDHVEFVAVAQVESEVDVVTEDLGQLHGQAVGQAGIARCREQRAVDPAVRVAGVQLRLDQIAFEYVTLVSLAQIEGFKIALLDLQGLQLASGVQQELDLLAFAQAGEALGVLVAGQDVVHEVARQPCLGEYRGEGVALAHSHAFPGWSGWRGRGLFAGVGEFGVLFRVFSGAVVVAGGRGLDLYKG
ncbi:hypothetical protein D3C76_729540 [compost metagenome]